MNSVERVIFDVLARRGSVSLPGLGSLEVKRRKAHRVSDTTTIPAADVAVFSTAEDGVSVVDLLNRNENMSMDDAWATYNAWIEESRDGGSLIIEGVGTVRDGHFEPTDHFHEMLNPEKSSSRSYDDDHHYDDEPKRRCGLWWLWLLLGLLVVGGAGWYFRDAIFCAKPKVAPVVVQPVVDSLAADSLSLSTAVDFSAARLDVPRYYVIAGAFLVPGNAEKRMTELRRDYGDLEVAKIQNPNGFEMVAIFSSTDRTEAYRFMNRHLYVCEWLWVYYK